MFSKINGLLLGMVIFMFVLFIIVIILAIFLKKKMGSHKISNKLDKLIKNAKYKLTSLLIKVDDVTESMMVSDNGYTYTMTVEVFGTNFFDSLNVEKSNTSEVFVSVLDSIRRPFQLHTQSCKHRTDDTTANYEMARQRLAKDIDDFELEIGVVEASIEDEIEKIEKVSKEIDDFGLEIGVVEASIEDEKVDEKEKIEKVSKIIKEKQGVLERLEEGITLLVNEKKRLQKSLNARKLSLKQTEGEMGHINHLASSTESPDTRTYYVLSYNFNTSLYAAANLSINEIKKKAFQELSAKANNIKSNFESIGIKANILEKYDVPGPIRKYFRPYLADKVDLKNIYLKTNINDVVTTTDDYMKLQQAANAELYTSNTDAEE